jgi:DNA end-binding protein Ku
MRMARSIWSGAISFGLVNVPVKLYTAVSRRTVHFHQLHAADRQRIQQRRVCSLDGEEVPYEQIVKGYEVSPGQFVVVETAELEALDPVKTRTIEVEQFVDPAEIDTMLYDTPYWVVPVAGAAKAYQLMHRAMVDAQRVAIGRVVLRQKGHLVALRPHGELLSMETMIYADELVSPDSLDDAGDAAGGKVAAKELQVARQLIEMLSGPFEPERYRDDYRDAVLALIERKVAGEEIAVAPAPAAAEPVPDLMAALQASIAAVGKHAGAIDGDGAPAAAKPRRRTAPAASKPRAGSRKP